MAFQDLCHDRLAAGLAACGPAPILQVMTKIHQSAIMSAPTTSQYAAITALQDLRSGDRPDAGRGQYAPPPGGAQL